MGLLLISSTDHQTSNGVGVEEKVHNKSFNDASEESTNRRIKVNAPTVNQADNKSTTKGQQDCHRGIIDQSLGGDVAILESQALALESYYSK